ARFTDGAQPFIRDQFEIDVVREPQDASDGLRRRKADRILEQPRHVGLPLGFEPSRADAIFEQSDWISVAPGLVSPEIKELSGKLRPHRLNALQNPGLEGTPLSRT